MRGAAAAVLPLEAMLTLGSTSSRPTGSAERVPLPQLRVGQHMLERLPVHEQPQDGSSWRDDHYLSVNPFVATFGDARVHTNCGIVRTRDGVVAETLWQTDESAGYVRRGDRIVLATSGTVQRQPGKVLSLLGGNCSNLYHGTLECVGRLAAADVTSLQGCSAVLLPASSEGFQTETLALLGLNDPQRWSLRIVQAGDVVRVEQLVLPWTMSGHHRPHPTLRRFFAPMTAAALAASPAWLDGAWPTRLYVDRRRAGHRRLVNETELIEALAAFGFVPVQLETLPLATQIALFARADAIVAPHGAGLTHLLHAAPGCRVLELQMDAWVSWSFRRLAAIGGVRYDCVIGRSLPGPQLDWVHARRWRVSPTHVLAAVEALLGT